MNFKCEMLYKFQGSKSFFFWLQGPPDVLYLKELHQIIISFMMNMIRNGEEDFREGFWISNVTCYINFRAPNLPSFEFRVLQMSCIWKNSMKLSFPSRWIWLETGNRIIEKDLNFKRDMLYKFQGSKSSFFWLQGPPDVLYLKK